MYAQVIRKKLSPQTKTFLKELGNIAPGDNQPAPECAPLPDLYWSATAAYWAYVDPADHLITLCSTLFHFALISSHYIRTFCSLVCHLFSSDFILLLQKSTVMFSPDFTPSTQTPTRYLYSRLTMLQIDVTSMSQLVGGMPTKCVTPSGEACANHDGLKCRCSGPNYPSVTMLSWVTGQPTARWVR